MGEGTARLGRAAGAAALSTFAALALHVLAGGHSPAGPATALALLASFAVAAQLAGRPLGRWRLAVTLGLSQLAFHLAFSAGDAAPVALEGHAAHHPVASGAALEAAAPVSAHAASMPLAHVLAAAATYAGVRRASTLLGALTVLGRVLARALLAALRIAPRPVPAPAPRTPTRARTPRIVLPVALAVPATRGPPATA